MKSKTELALELKCPRCKMTPGTMCKAKILVSPWEPPYLYEMTRPHRERYRLVTVRDKAKLQPREIPREMATVAMALRDHDARERDQLRAWLAAHGNILWSSVSCDQSLPSASLTNASQEAEG